MEAMGLQPLPRSLRATAAAIAFTFVATAITSCGGGEHSTAPDVIGKIALSPTNSLAFTPGSTLQLTASVASTTGKPMPADGLSYISSAPAIATVSGTGLVTTVGPVGRSSISASIGTVQSNSILIMVVAGPPAALTRTSPDPGTVAPGATVGDSVRFVVKDAFGNPIAHAPITFSISAGNGSASPASSQTDEAGRVATVFTTGLTAGANTLNAVVTGIPAVALSLVTAVGSVNISAVGPGPMTPGSSITIDGSGFDPVVTGDVVTIDGQNAPVTGATTSQIVAVIPSVLPCQPTHQARIQVTANGATAFASQTLRAGVPRPMNVGATVVLTSAADVSCSELSPANGHYIVNIVNPFTNPTGLTPFHLVGATSIPAGTSFSPNVFALRQSIRLPEPPPATGNDATPYIRGAAHLARLESNRAIYASMKKNFRRVPKRSVKPGAAAGALSIAVPTIGQTRTFRVLQPSTALGASADCTTYTEITARAVYVGTRAIVYEDVAAPLHNQMDSYFTALGQEFDNSMYPSDATYFGDPLITDPSTDNDQHLNMVFTPSIPSTLGGFVVSCDFFPRSLNNTASNLGENFYARVPKVSGTGFADDTPDRWYRSMRATVVHEVKHIASYGAHLVNGANGFEESWLEESTAMIAEEVWGRDRIYAGATWKGNMLYSSTVFCDVRPTTPSCNTPPLVMFDHFASLYPVLRQPDATSLFGRVSSNDFSFYYAAWSFVRHIIDRYAGSEVDFLRGLTQATNTTGISNLERQASAGRTSMMGNWSLALYLDENPTMASNGDVAFPSWHLRDIYRGINSDFPSQFPQPFPLVPVSITGGDFSIDNQGLHGGSFASYDLPGVAANARTVGLTGAPPLTIAIARIE
jgi:hypothetical protein